MWHKSLAVRYFICNLRSNLKEAVFPMKRRGARVVEEARLESVYTPKAYHGFESRSLRKETIKNNL